ncbi:MAG: hypothetical protein A2W29_06630 [Gemmatimonadetes bacterium RBG_16_66_8]|nr:MAG: hypothetical protein A2W29_06630 [Gemmatimonadetes bacterium RBG_16_66_8]
MDTVNLFDFEARARERLDPATFGFINGGAADEITLRDNVAAFGRYRLLPRVLMDVAAVDAGVRVLGQDVRFPVLLAPTAFQ